MDEKEAENGSEELLDSYYRFLWFDFLVEQTDALAEDRSCL
jgi:hypothetical protein